MHIESSSSARAQRIESAPSQEKPIQPTVSLSWSALQKMKLGAQFVRGLGGHTANFLRLATAKVQMGALTPAMQTECRAVGGTWGAMVSFVSLSGIFLEVQSTLSAIATLRTSKQASKKAYAKAIFRPFLPHHPFVKDIVGLATGALIMATHVKTTVTPALLTAGQVLGMATGALNIVFGAAVATVHTKNAIEAHTKLRELKSHLSDKTLSEEKRTELEAEIKKQKWERTKSILKAATGALITISGALIIAAGLSTGVGLVAISAAAFVIGLVALTVSVGTAIKDRRELRPSSQRSSNLKRAASALINQAKSKLEFWKSFVLKQDNLFTISQQNVGLLLASSPELSSDLQKMFSSPEEYFSKSLNEYFRI